MAQPMTLPVNEPVSMIGSVLSGYAGHFGYLYSVERY
jgi:hypothetical protein